MSQPIVTSVAKPAAVSLAHKDTKYTKIFVGGLPYHTTDESLRDFFVVFGEIEEAVVITDRQTGKSKGYGFVTMTNQAAAERACKDPNPIIDGRKANVNLAYIGAKPRNQPVPGITTLQSLPGTVLSSQIPGAYPLVYHPATHAPYVAHKSGALILSSAYPSNYVADGSGTAAAAAAGSLTYPNAYFTTPLVQQSPFAVQSNGGAVLAAPAQPGIPVGAWPSISSLPATAGVTYAAMPSGDLNQGLVSAPTNSANYAQLMAQLIQQQQQQQQQVERL